MSMSPTWTVNDVRVSSMAAALPAAVMTNEDLIAEGADPEYVARMSETVGVLERRVVVPAQFGSDLALSAARRVLEHEGWGPDDLDILVVGTQTPDRLFPGISFALHRALGLGTDCAVFDVNLGCSAFVYGAWLVSTALAQGGRRGLLVTVDTMSRTLRRDDWGNRVLFGDAAAAVAFTKDEDAASIRFSLASDGRGADSVCLPGTAMQAGIDDAVGFRINGPAVLGLALRSVPRMLVAMLGEESPTLVVPHQANGFILEKLRERLGTPTNQFVVAMSGVGNTSSATIPLALCSGDPRVEAGDRSSTAMVGFGTGFSWGAMLADLGATVRLGTSDVAG